MSRFPIEVLRGGRVALVFVASVSLGAQTLPEERLTRLEGLVDTQGLVIQQQAARIKELELSLYQVTVAQMDGAQNDQLSVEVEAVVDRILEGKLDGRGSSVTPSRVSVRGQGRFVLRAFDGATISTDQSFEIEHLLVQLTMDLGDGFEAHVTPAVSHSGSLALITAYVDYEVADWLEARAGRFLIPFNGVHAWAFPSDSFIEPYLPENSPKPFFYAPYWDEGLMLRGRHELGEGDVSLRYAAYISNGIDGPGLDGFHKRSIGDNNLNKTIGGRVSADFRLRDGVSLTVGLGAMTGKWDSGNELGFHAAVLDAELTLGAFSLYIEAFHRATEVEGGVIENPTVNVREVARLTGLKVRPRIRLSDDFTLYAQADYLQLRQPPRSGGLFSALAAEDHSTSVLSWIVGLEYALASGAILYAEGGVFHRDKDLGPDISFISAGLTFSF